mmetsp:Transcript_11566/g.26718  ORF Transcript_11566/g.26718 Transcript_11566/m.26718 type:complete len:215 (+) Transcript_11566:1188-1832(+)
MRRPSLRWQFEIPPTHHWLPRLHTDVLQRLHRGRIRGTGRVRGHQLSTHAEELVAGPVLDNCIWRHFRGGDHGVARRVCRSTREPIGETAQLDAVLERVNCCLVVHVRLENLGASDEPDRWGRCLEDFQPVGDVGELCTWLQQHKLVVAGVPPTIVAALSHRPRARAGERVAPQVKQLHHEEAVACRLDGWQGKDLRLFAEVEPALRVERVDVG